MLFGDAMLNFDENNNPLDVISALHQLVWCYGAGTVINVNLYGMQVKTKLTNGHKIYNFTVSAYDNKITIRMCGHQRTVKSTYTVGQ